MGKGQCRQANCYILLFCFLSCHSDDAQSANFFIIQAAITIAVHLLEHRENAAAQLSFVDHAIAVKAASEFFKAAHVIIIDVDLFCH